MVKPQNTLSESISGLFKTVKYVAQATGNFKRELKLLSETIQRITPIIQDMIKMNPLLDRTEAEYKMFIEEIQEAEKLIGKCLKVKRNLFKKYTYSLKLKDFNGRLLRFFQIDVQAIQTRDITETLKGANDIKECFLDLGLFPEDQRIPVSALLNMWVHLYNHDDDGRDTMARIFELSYRHLVDLMTAGFWDESIARVNHCDQQFVTQNGLLWELAIHLNNKLPLPQRSRLIINAQGEDLPASIKHVQEPMQARILSISTGESFSSQWCNMEVPCLEVLILNLKSKTYTLPPFLAGSQKLKILNITNHGLYPIQFNNFHLLTSSHKLTRIRLECVAITPSILLLMNLQKVSLIMCKIGNSFKELFTNTPNIWPQLGEIEIDYCQDLVEFPGILCNSIHLKKISITNCNKMCGFDEEFGNSINLKTLSLRSCTKLEKLPESIWRLEKLSVLDISNCLSLIGLPEKMGKLGNLRTIYMKGCPGVHELPKSVEELSHVRVVCNEEIAYQWQEYSTVEIELVE